MEMPARRAVRDTLVVDAAVMMHGYASLMRSFNEMIAQRGIMQAMSEWRKKLEKLARDNEYAYEGWRGDLFNKRNPLWQQIGVVKPGKEGLKLTVLNTGSARSECGRVLRQLLAMDGDVRDLKFLATR